jgi:hypothetical protein
MAVCWLGLHFARSRPEASDAVVRFYGPNGPADRLTSGTVALELGRDRRVAELGPGGQADFKQVPMEFFGASVRVAPDIKGYVLRGSDLMVLPNDGVLLVQMDRAAQPASTIRGRLQTTRGPVTGVVISLEHGEATGVTNERGEFVLTTHRAPGALVNLTGTDVKGRTVYDGLVTLKGSDAPLALWAER